VTRILEVRVTGTMKSVRVKEVHQLFGPFGEFSGNCSVAPFRAVLGRLLRLCVTKPNNVLSLVVPIPATWTSLVVYLSRADLIFGFAMTIGRFLTNPLPSFSLSSDISRVLILTQLGSCGSVGRCGRRLLASGRGYFHSCFRHAFGLRDGLKLFLEALHLFLKFDILVFKYQL
jgi:hypothetical protein